MGEINEKRGVDCIPIDRSLSPIILRTSISGAQSLSVVFVNSAA